VEVESRLHVVTGKLMSVCDWRSMAIGRCIN